MATAASKPIKSRLLDEQCRKHKAIDCDLVHSVVWVESNYINKTISDAGSLSYGPGQIKCATARLMGFKGKCRLLYNPRISLKYVVRYVNHQLVRYDMNRKKALAAYNAGTAIVCKKLNEYKCYPGEFVNERYVWSTSRRYKWLRSKRQKICKDSQIPCRRLDTLETSQTSIKSEYLTFSEGIAEHL